MGYYFKLMFFRMKEPLTDFKATGLTYLLFCFFIWMLSTVWLKFNAHKSLMTFSQVFIYVGITEMLFMSFVNSKQVIQGTEDFSLFLARPRSWIGRELVANIGLCFGKRILFVLSLLLFSFLLKTQPESLISFASRTAFFILLLALPQALLVTFFGTLRLSYPQTDYFILPFGKLFLSLGGVFGPLSDYGEPWRQIFLKLPGSDLFFQPAYYVVYGNFYQMGIMEWLERLFVINFILLGSVIYFYRKGRRSFQSWGG